MHVVTNAIQTLLTADAIDVSPFLGALGTVPNGLWFPDQSLPGGSLFWQQPTTLLDAPLTPSTEPPEVFTNLVQGVGNLNPTAVTPEPDHFLPTGVSNLLTPVVAAYDEPARPGPLLGAYDEPARPGPLLGAHDQPAPFTTFVIAHDEPTPPNSLSVQHDQPASAQGLTVWSPFAGGLTTGDAFNHADWLLS
jgi:hypothetical protein